MSSSSCVTEDSSCRWSKCTLNLSWLKVLELAWCGSKGSGVQAQVSSSSLEIRVSSPKLLELLLFFLMPPNFDCVRSRPTKFIMARVGSRCTSVVGLEHHTGEVRFSLVPTQL
ncbi:hypothetical protein TNCV_71261 [Trichonephila clavipes]|nr:hypothetical protein TNCV_71261 [Trichonephila clavipes]